MTKVRKILPIHPIAARAGPPPSQAPDVVPLHKGSPQSAEKTARWADMVFVPEEMDRVGGSAFGAILS